MASSSALPACHSTPTRGVFFVGCCARAASGTAAALREVMNSRRLINCPEAQTALDGSNSPIERDHHATVVMSAWVKSRHVQRTSRCPLSARSGHLRRKKAHLLHPNITDNLKCEGYRLCESQARRWQGFASQPFPPIFISAVFIRLQETRGTVNNVSPARKMIAMKADPDSEPLKGKVEVAACSGKRWLLALDWSKRSPSNFAM